MKKTGLMLVLVLASVLVKAQTMETKERMRQLIKENFALADSQYRYMMTLTPPGKMPQSYDEKNKKMIADEITWW